MIKWLKLACEHAWKMRPKWLFVSAKPSHLVELGQKNIYILPSRGGLGYLLVCLLMWVMAVNYQNNLVYILLFLLLAVFVVTILHSFANLKGLIFHSGKDVIAEQSSYAQIQVKVSGRTSHSDIQLSLHDRTRLIRVNRSPTYYELEVDTHQRGVENFERLKVTTGYPLGLFRAWSYVKLSVHVYIYPKPLECALPEASLRGIDSDETDVMVKRVTLEPSTPSTDAEFEMLGREMSDQVGDEPLGYRSYSPSDRISRVYWPALARGAGMQVTTFSEPLPLAPADSYWLDYHDFSRCFVQYDHEQVLSCLCFWVKRCAEQGVPFGLALPNQPELPVSSDGNQLNRALKALANA